MTTYLKNVFNVDYHLNLPYILTNGLFFPVSDLGRGVSHLNLENEYFPISRRSFPSTGDHLAPDQDLEDSIMCWDLRKVPDPVLDRVRVKILGFVLKLYLVV